MTAPTGVLLMTYGSAVTSADVPEYMRSVYRGDPPPEVVKEFQYRYDVVGRSPLIDITRAQGRALQEELDRTAGPGEFVVEVGMLHSAPWIRDGVARLAEAGVKRALGIVLSPQYSPVIMGRYPARFEEAAAEHGIETVMAGPWHLVPSFVECLANRVAEALAKLGDVPVLFTAHSLPKAVVDRDLAYLDQLNETIEAVAERVGLPSDRWQFAYQSSGHTPEEWLKPDMKDLFPELRAAGHEAVLIVPVQFLADHLEILFDIDVAGREQADEVGIAFHRTELPNTDPVFIRALREVVERELRAPVAAG